MLALFKQFLVAVARTLMLKAFNGIYWLDERLPNALPIQLSEEELDDDEDDEDGPPSDLSSMSMTLKPVYFGQLVIQCPACEYETEEVGMGVGTLEQPFDDNDFSAEKEMGLPNMVQIGVIAYPCGHSIHSTHLTDKVVNILNAQESGKLTPAMVMNLAEVE